MLDNTLASNFDVIVAAIEENGTRFPKPAVHMAKLANMGLLTGAVSYHPADVLERTSAQLILGGNPLAFKEAATGLVTFPRPSLEARRFMSTEYAQIAFRTLADIARRQPSAFRPFC